MDNAEAQAFFAIQARNLARVSREGITIALGTDGNTPWGPHLEMADMVATGMSPADVLVAATRNAAAFLKLDDAGTRGARQDRQLHRARGESARRHRNTRKIREVYLRGDKVDRTTY